MLAEFIEKAFAGANLNPAPGRYLKGWLRQAGAEDVHEGVATYGLGASEPDPEWAVKAEVSIIAMIKMYEAIASRKSCAWRRKKGLNTLQGNLITSTRRKILRNWKRKLRKN
jgi:hypothetical protein